MTRVGDELLHRGLRAVALGERVGHLRDRPVIGDRQRAQLVFAVRFDGLRREIAGREPLERFGHIHERPQRLMGEEAREQRAEHDRERQREAEARYEAPDRRAEDAVVGADDDVDVAEGGLRLAQAEQRCRAGRKARRRRRQRTLAGRRGAR